jgi:hypothetical protein
MLAGFLSSGYPAFTLTTLGQLISLWLLVDPILGTLWELVVARGLWRKIWVAPLPSPPKRGFFLPYVQANSAGGQFVLTIRRYQAWWRTSYWPEAGDSLITFGLGASLALLISFFLNPILLWLTLLVMGLTLLAGQSLPDLTAPGGGRLPAVGQFLLPWAMGAVLGAALTPASLLMAVCYGVMYLGGLRMAGNHQRAEILFFLGQMAVILLLLALRSLPGAALLSMVFIPQTLIYSKFKQPLDFLPKVQLHLIITLLIAGFSLGSL